jgi:phospholipase C
MLRRFVRYHKTVTLLATVPLAACGGGGGGSPVAAVIRSPAPMANAAVVISHVVFIVQENRTPDHLLNGFPGPS